MTIAERLRLARRETPGQSEPAESGPMSGPGPGLGPRPRLLSGEATALPGWELLPDGCLRRKETLTWEGPDFIGHLPVPGLAPLPIPMSRVRFFDLETTGLSAAAGTAVFLAGIGRIVEGKLTVEQRMITDFPAERGIVSWFASEAASDVCWVSYNGRSFDGPVLENRAIIHRSSLYLARHLDLLRFARRFWKRRLESCSLGSVEEHILAHSRPLDIPSALVPEVFLAWLESRDHQSMIPVAAHHLDDIRSLARLTVLLDGILGQPLAATGVDRSMLARCLLEQGRPQEALSILSIAITSPEKDAGPDEQVRCARMAAAMYAREGDRDTARRIARNAWQNLRDPWCGRFLAVDAEHHLRDFSAAHALARELTAVPSLPNWLGEDLRRRLQRLEGKLAPSGTD